VAGAQPPLIMMRVQAREISSLFLFSSQRWVRLATQTPTIHQQYKAVSWCIASFRGSDGVHDDCVNQQSDSPGAGGWYPRIVRLLPSCHAASSMRVRSHNMMCATPAGPGAYLGRSSLSVPHSKSEGHLLRKVLNRNLLQRDSWSECLHQL
jgi:hypothetical protein